MLLSGILSWAVVTLSTGFMRQAPDYESALENQLLMGALVQTCGSERYWVKVQAEDYTGWVTGMGIRELTDEEKDSYLRAEKWICTAVCTRVLEAPSAEATPLCDLTMGGLVRKTEDSCGDWLKVLLPGDGFGWVRSCDVADFREVASRAASASSVCSLACSFRGTPYMWGGNSSKYFDCSGLVKLCFFMNGLILPRNAGQQIKCGIPVAHGAWQPGDLLFFGSKKPLRASHVAIYLGDGCIVHSSQLVRTDRLEEYGREVIGAVRILGDGDKPGVKSVLDSPYYFAQDGK